MAQRWARAIVVLTAALVVGQILVPSWNISHPAIADLIIRTERHVLWVKPVPNASIDWLGTMTLACLTVAIGCGILIGMHILETRNQAAGADS